MTRSERMIVLLCLTVFLSLPLLSGAAAGPDLVITDVMRQSWNICYKIRNIGDVSAVKGHITRLEVDGNLKDDDLVEVNMLPNAELSRCFPSHSWVCSGGSDKLETCADSNGVISESNETNNCRTEIWACPVEICTNVIDDDNDQLADCNDPDCASNPHCMDTDHDGIPDAEDNCPLVSNQNQSDKDADGDGDVCDNCPNTSNPDQKNTDGDSYGDACDTDDDNDGYSDAEEINKGSDPLNPNSTPEVCDGNDNDLDGKVDEGYTDTDLDGIANCVDPDDDNDGYTDAEEIAAGTDPLDPESNPNLPPQGTINDPSGNVSIYIGDKLNFAGTGADPDQHVPLKYRWNFGSGSGINSSNAEDPGYVTFNNPGIFTVTFTITDAKGKSDPTPASIQVSVNSPAVPDEGQQTSDIQHIRQDSQSEPFIRFKDGVPGFVAAQIALPDDLRDDPVVKSLYFLKQYNKLYLLYDPEKQLYLERIKTDGTGGQHIFLKQKHGDIPVFGAQIGVHMRGKTITGTNGRYLPEIPWLPPALIDKEQAENIALNSVPGTNVQLTGESRLMYFNGSLVGAQGSETHLAWRVVVVGKRTTDNAYTMWTNLVDAHNGDLLFRTDELRTGDRPGEDFDIETVNNSESSVCWVWWDWWNRDDWFDENGSVGYPGAGSDPFEDGQHAYDFSHETYHFYYDTFSRRSWGNNGEMDVKVHSGSNWRNASYIPGCDLVNFGDSYVVRDVFAHEFTHGVTSHTSDLIYANQSGALNESYSDAAGMLVDDDDWLMAEDIETNAEDTGAGGTAGGGVGDGNRESGDNCGNGADDDGDGFIDEGCPETGDQCGNSLDNDGDGFIDEGCSETGTDCGDLADDDADGFADEGCPGSCFDGIDNAGDGAFDIADNNCFHRDVSNPPRRGDPDHMDAAVSGDGVGLRPACTDCNDENDQGGVHTNSGIPNKVFYLIAEGGSHNGIAVGGIGRIKAQRLYYDVLTGRLTESSQFIDARDATVEQARDYLRDGEYYFYVSDICDVINAFASVGLGARDLDCDGLDDLEDTDDDDDDVGDGRDNCPELYNPAQWDYDDDGIGNDCDLDDDGDGVCDTGGPYPVDTPGAPSGCTSGPAGADNCPVISNSDQSDADGDGRGDLCDNEDGDSIIDTEDNCPNRANGREDWTDINGDPHYYEQPDYDLDGMGDACDPDDDNDGILDDGDGSGDEGDHNCSGGFSADCDDNCRLRYNSSQADSDFDAVGNSCDNCNGIFNPEQVDIDEDGTGDDCDGDIDGDGVPNGEDNCPYIPNPSQAEFEGIGVECYPFDDYVRMMQGPPAEFAIIFGDGLNYMDIPFVFDPCQADDCPEYIHEDYRAEMSISVAAGIAVSIMDDRGVMAANSAFGEPKTMSFFLKNDHYYTPPAMGPAMGPINRAAAQQTQSDEDVFRGTRYVMRLYPLQGIVPGQKYNFNVSFFADTDGDGILDDGSRNGVPGDAPCTGGNTVQCDDNCIGSANEKQTDTDSDKAGDACDNCRLVKNEDQKDDNDPGDDNKNKKGVQHYGDICDPDFDNDGLVTLSDYAVWRKWYRQAVPPAPVYVDLDNDNLIGLGDYAVWRKYYRNVPGPGIE